VPEVIPELSTSRVLTLELLEGQPLSAVLKEPSNTSNQKRLQISAGLIASLYGPLLSSGLVHADPHPGNFLVLPDGRLGVLDFGSVKRYLPELTEAYREVYRSLLQATEPDYERLLARTGFEVHVTPREYRPVLAQFFDLMRLPLRVDSFDFGDAQLVREFQGVARQNAAGLRKLRPPADSLMLFRAFGGQGQNLRALGAAGNFAPIYARVFEVAVGDWNSSTAA
jgi:predicted unusual protein kinase regulating ubiquinone biosynthesis (AarF/ABC1/UbiB family)